MSCDGAMRAVPQGADGDRRGLWHESRRQAFRRVLVPQMWVYALPGLSNLWMILIKATPLLFLLGIEDIVYWAQASWADQKTQRLSPIRTPTGGSGTSLRC